MPSYEIHGRKIWKWDILFRNGCIPRYNIQRKNEKKLSLKRKPYSFKLSLKRKPYSIYIFTSYHPSIVKAHVWQTRSLENPTNKLLWGSISDFKSAWWTEASHTILKEKLLLEVKLTERKTALLKKKTTRKKKTEILLFVIQYQPLVSIKKRLKSGISNKTNHYLAKILKNHLKCYFFEKGKLWHWTCLLEPKHEGNRCAACHPLQSFNENNLSIQKARVQ